MNVKIRKRLTSPEKTSLNLEITKDGKRITESLGLFIYNFPKTKFETSENKKTIELAEHLRAERLIQLQDKQFGTHRQDNGKENFLKYLSVVFTCMFVYAIGRLGFFLRFLGKS